MTAIANGTKFHKVINEAGAEKLAAAISTVVDKAIAADDYKSSDFDRRVRTNNILKELKRSNPPAGMATRLLTALGVPANEIAEIVNV